MQILLITATDAEIAPFISSSRSRINENKHSITHLVTGVGMVATAYKTGVMLANNLFDIIINAGISGAIDRSLNQGEVVEVVEEQFYYFGAEDHDSFLSIFELGLIDENEFPFVNKKLINNSDFQGLSFPGIKKVRGITVQTVHGGENSINQLTMRHPEAMVESMEGAAFFYAALLSKIPFIQLRAISNYVEPRNRSNWKIELAIKNLNEYLIRILL